MKVLGYSGLNGAMAYNKSNNAPAPGEERITQGLDSAASIIVDGKVIAAASEERFTFAKKCDDFPVNAISFCLNEAGLTIDEIDYIAHGFDYGSEESIFKAVDNDYYDSILKPEKQIKLWQEKFGVALLKQAFIPVNHHIAHAASAYYPSGFDEALCVVCDGMGEMSSLTIYSVKNGNFKVLDSFYISDSIGILYSVITMHLGFKFNSDEYKVMGLAPYGNPEKFRSFFNELVSLREKGRFGINYQAFTGKTNKDPFFRNFRNYLSENVIPNRINTDELKTVHHDFAAAMQECLEKCLLHVLRYWKQTTGYENLCYSGGVALNCTFNGKLIEEQLFDRIYIQPASGDDGSAIGAAYHVCNQMKIDISPSNQLDLPFYGPSFSNDEILEALKKFDGQIIVEDLGSVENAAKDAAQSLMEEFVISWFQGRMEYGPRALGNRSILANPTVPDIKEKLNRIIKLREGFRPFAPAVVEEKANDYFKVIQQSPFDYMLSICQVKEEWQKRLPGVTHVNASARVQTVNAQKNPLFHNLISQFGEKSGVSCVVNTSFNVRGQPIIVSPEIAVETFLKVNIDRLYMNSIRVKKLA